MGIETQLRIAQLVGKGRTLTAIADELGATPLTIELWKVRKRHPTNAKPVLLTLARISEKKRIQKRGFILKAAIKRRQSGGNVA
ncbi:MAG: hypothetical protein ACOC7P_03235 [Chloroflexota bacterium]